MQQVGRHIIVTVIDQFVHLTLGKLTREIVHSVLVHSSIIYVRYVMTEMSK